MAKRKKYSLVDGKLTAYEFVEQENFVNYLKLRSIPHAAIMHDGYDHGAERARKKRMGSAKGVFDLEIYLGKIPDCVLVKVELKRTAGGRIGEEQKALYDFYNACDGVVALICYGCKDAIEQFEEVEKEFKKVYKILA